jgi:Na+-transporting methylmalonyl-CoA/oxaloacetate decarboxylase gamma subunit
MDRRLVIAAVFLVLVIVALALMGMSSVPQQAGGDPPLRPLLPWMMSGDFAPTRYAAAGTEAASPAVGGAAPSCTAPTPS